MGENRRSVLLIACGALAHELRALQRLGGWDHVAIQCLPAELHNRPQEIPGAVREKLEQARGRFDEVFVAYADCGTAGRLDSVLAEYDAERLPGAHCYAFFAGIERFAALHDAEPGTFYLTDFLVRHFDRLVIRGLGIDRHPELLTDYFGNYRRVMYLAQTPTPELDAKALDCARQLGLEFERCVTGLDGLARALPTASTLEPRAAEATG